MSFPTYCLEEENKNKQQHCFLIKKILKPRSVCLKDFQGNLQIIKKLENTSVTFSLLCLSVDSELE